MLPQVWRWSVTAGLVLLSAQVVGAAAAQSFVYVAAPICATAPGCSAGVLVYDSGTAGLVTRIALPPDMTPAGLAMAPDGSRLYISVKSGPNNVGASVVIVDARSHQLFGQFTTATAGPVAVSRDGSRVFVAAPSSVDAYDAVSGRALAHIEPGLVLGLATSTMGDRFYTTSFAGSGSSAVPDLNEFDGIPAASTRP